jgi:hypothetical protein
MKRVIKLTESQLEKLTETRINEVSAIELANVLRDIPCTGESVKSLINDKLLQYGVKIKKSFNISYTLKDLFLLSIL